MSIIKTMLMLQSSLKVQTGLDIQGWCIGPKEWLYLRTEIEAQVGKPVPQLDQCQLAGFPVTMKAAPGIDLVVHPDASGRLAQFWEQEENKQKQSVWVSAGSELVN